MYQGRWNTLYVRTFQKIGAPFTLLFSIPEKIKLGILNIVISRKSGSFPKSPTELLEIINLTAEREYVSIIAPFGRLSLNGLLERNQKYEAIELLGERKPTLEAETSTNIPGDYLMPVIIPGRQDKTVHKIQIESEKSLKKVNLLYRNQVHYLPFKAGTGVKLKASSPVFFGQPHRYHSLNQTKPNLVVHLMIDALPQVLFDEMGYDCMPNTMNFFSENSQIYKNCFAQSEWTLSSMASVFTGQHTKDHLIYHPKENQKIGSKTLADAFREKGYYTFSCTNIPRITPNNWFNKGFDRFVGAPNHDLNFVIEAAIDQLSCFKTDQYLFLGIFDIHDSHGVLPLNTQAKTEIEFQRYQPLLGNSKDTRIQYDTNRLQRLMVYLQYLDQKLLRLFDLIDQLDADVSVVMHSDHGVNFLSNTTELLGKEREKSFLFVKSPNLPNTTVQTFTELRYVGGLLSSIAGLDFCYRPTEPGVCITESIYPGKSYELAIRDKKHTVIFKNPWEMLLKKDQGFSPDKVSVFCEKDETIRMEISHENEYLIEIAKNHYQSLIGNFQGSI